MTPLLNWWAERTTREQGLLAVMVALLLATISWYGLWQPLQSARVSAAERLESAGRLREGVARQMALLKSGTAASMPSAPLAQIVSQSATAAGFQPSTVDRQTEGQLNVTLPAARARALFGWLLVLEKQGVVVEQAQLTTKSDGSLSATLTVQQAK